MGLLRASYPIPEGVTASFSAPKAGANTATFTLPYGLAVLTFQPVDANAPGTVTLYDSAGNSVLTMNHAGHYSLAVPAGGKSYYFNPSAGANLLAATIPNSLR
jgi:hypothetical protein